MKHHWFLTFIMIFAASAIISQFVLGLTWPKRVLSGLSITLVAITYFTFFAATAIFVKLMGKRLLAPPRRLGDSTYWSEREKTEASLEHLKKQG